MRAFLRFSLPVAVALASVGTSACGSGRLAEAISDAGRADAPDDVGVAVAPDAASTIDAEAGASLTNDGGGDASGPIQVSGHVVDIYAGAFVASRKVTLVDATGARTEVTTDANGAFQADGIVPPYDALVAAGPYGGANPVVYLGVTVAHPRLHGWPDVGYTTGSATVNVLLQEPSCGASTCQVWLTAFGCNGEEVQFNGGVTTYQTATTEPISAPTGWYNTTSPCIGYDVLVSDSTFTHYWYAEVTAGTVSNGATVTTSTVVPSPIGTLGNVTLNVTEAPQIPSSWSPVDLDLFVVYGPQNNRRGVRLLGSGTSSAFGVPALQGPVMSAQASIENPTPDPSFWQYVTAFSPFDLPPTTTTIDLSLVPPQPLLAPAENGPISAATGSIGAWTWASSEMVMHATLVAHGEASDTTEVEVHTSGSAIDLGHLAAMGVTLIPSPHWGYFAAVGRIASLDAMLDETNLQSPDESQYTATNIAFTMTP